MPPVARRASGAYLPWTCAGSLMPSAFILAHHYHRAAEHRQRPWPLAISHPSSLKNRPNSQDCVFEARCVVCATMNRNYILGLEEIDETQVAIVGGKGANLGELSRLEGVRVPPG